MPRSTGSICQATRVIASAAIAAALLALNGCNWDWISDTSGADPPAIQSYALTATVSGLTSSGLVLTVNGTAVSVPAGATTQGLASSLPAGTSYSVTVQTQPAGETCTVADGTGTIQSANVTSVTVTCLDRSYTVGGTISGLTASSVVLATGTQTVTIPSGASSWVFPTAVPAGTNYATTVQMQPVGLTCAVTHGGSGTVTGNVTNVTVNCSALYHRSITIDHTQCGSSNSSNFPVLVSLSDSTLESAASGGHVQNGNGYDIYFYSDAGLTQRLPAERVVYNASSGQYIGWVQVPTISVSANTVFYIAYGDRSIMTDPNSDSAYGKTKVWDSNYLSVYHFSEATGSNPVDSTANANNGTQYHGPTQASIGPTGVSWEFNGTSQYVTDPAVLNPATTAYTVTFWARFNSLANEDIWQQPNGTAGTGRTLMGLSYPGGTFGTTYSFLGAALVQSTSSSSTGTWYYLGATYNGTDVALYFNGAQQSSTVVTAEANPGATLLFGVEKGLTGDFANGYFSEARLSNVARSSSWFTAEYNNQSSPGNIGSAGFYTVGSEQQGP